MEPGSQDGESQAASSDAFYMAQTVTRTGRRRKGSKTARTKPLECERATRLEQVGPKTTRAKPLGPLPVPATRSRPGARGQSEETEWAKNGDNQATWSIPVLATPCRRSKRGVCDRLRSSSIECERATRLEWEQVQVGENQATWSTTGPSDALSTGGKRGVCDRLRSSLNNASTLLAWSRSESKMARTKPSVYYQFRRRVLDRGSEGRLEPG
ncbi:hypothetical protein V1504DRAFT_472582 [Lipomyces starkeyi]